MWYNTLLCWKCDSSPHRSQVAANGAVYATPIRVSQLKNLANVCYVWEQNGFGQGWLYAANMYSDLPYVMPGLMTAQSTE